MSSSISNWQPREGMRYYNGNVNIKRAGEAIEWTKELIQEWAKCANDIEYFLENYVKIVHLDLGLVNFKLRSYQKKIVDLVMSSKNTIINTCRQCGKTTTIAGIILHYILFNEQKSVAILANKEDAAKETFKRLQTAYENLPKWLQQGALTWNKGDLKLENGCVVSVHGTSADAIRGKSINFLYIDEAARIEHWEEFAMSVLPTVSSGKTTKIVMTSTPNGLNYFYDYFEGAKKGTNGYGWLEVMWNEVPGRDEEWKKTTLAELNNDHDKFAQEYECQFMGSSGTLIAGYKLKQLIAEAKIPIFEDNNFHQFEQPIKNHNYVIIADVSAGKGLDFSAFHVVDISANPYRQVASFKDNMIVPSDYASVVYNAATHYNNAYILVENNVMGGEVILTLWDAFGYENMFCTASAGRAGKQLIEGYGGKASDFGVITTKPVRDKGCSMIKLLVEQNQLIIADMRTVSEFATFSKKTPTALKYEAEEGKNDDLAMGMVLFGWMASQPLFKDMTNSSIVDLIKERTEKEIEESMMPIGGLDNGSEEIIETVKIGNDVWSTGWKNDSEEY